MAYRIEQIRVLKLGEGYPTRYLLTVSGLTIDRFETREDALAGAQKLAKELESLIYHFDAGIEAPEVLSGYKADLEDLEDLLDKESN